MNNQVTAIVLAAGKGTRMKASDNKNKVVYALGQKPMIRYTINTLKQCGIGKTIVVVGFAKESVMAELGSEVDYAYQDNPQGTAHAVKVALPSIPKQSTNVVIMYGDDSAFYTTDLIDHLINSHDNHQNHLTIISIIKDDPYGLGRIIRGTDQRLLGVVEEKNASDDQKHIKEINTGLYCFNAPFLHEVINNIQPNPVSGEYYLTDAIEYACKHGYKAEAILWENRNIWFGINTPEQLKAAEERMMQKNAVQ